MYENTPSFYRDEQTFQRFLGYTSYYRALQDATCKLVGFLGPQVIVELGSSTGATALRLARELTRASIVAVDNSHEMTELGISNANDEGTNSVLFITGDMRYDVWHHVRKADLVLMLHSFHHIEDPLNNKANFLNSCFAALKSGAYLCIAETFVPASVESAGYVSEVRRLWAQRVLEARSSAFWNSLTGLRDEDLLRSGETSTFSAGCEAEAGQFVEQRKFEYCVALSDLAVLATNAGFRVLLKESVNSLGDAIVLLHRT